MTPFVAKPGETIVGLGFDFVRRLAAGETLSLVSLSASGDITAANGGANQTTATATVTVNPDAVDGDASITFTVTGSAGSVRKATRSILIRAVSE